MMKTQNPSLKTRRREPLTDTQLLMTITICIFVVMYLAAILFLGGAVLVAVGYSIALIRLTKLYKPSTITWMQNIVGMIYFIPLAFVMERLEPSALANVRDYIVPILCLGVFCSAIAYALWAFAFSKLGASKANVYSNLIPVFTAIFSYLLAIEALTVNKIIGILVVVVGLVLSQTKTKKAATS